MAYKKKPDPRKVLVPDPDLPPITRPHAATTGLSSLPPDPENLQELRAGRKANLVLPDGSPSDESEEPQEVIGDELRRVLTELAGRRAEALFLYKPLPEQFRFHKERPQHRLLIGSNRGGKTLPAAAEVARAVTGTDPFGKYPKKDGRVVAVGKSLLQVGQVLYRKLFRAGAFKMIRDLLTGRWRVFRPNDPLDANRETEARLVPPLIPHRFVKSISWLDKKSDAPRLVKLTTGWEIMFFSGDGKPPQGMDVDLVWFDEEIPESDWLPEMQARLLDRNGCLIWSATPQAGTEHLYDLHERAAEEKTEYERGNTTVKPAVAVYNIFLDDNEFMANQAKEDFKRNQKTEEAYRVRVGGQFAIQSHKVYPEHGDRMFVPWFPIPEDWTTYVSIDPGRQRMAALFWAVPPPSLKKHWPHQYVYDELYVKDCTAKRFGEEMEKKLRGRLAQIFLIDYQEAKKHETASGRTIAAQYAKALKRNKVRSVLTGHNFMPGNADVKGGIEHVREWLADCEEDDRPKLLFLRGKTENLDKEMQRYRYKVVKEVITDDVVKKNDHLCDCLRYLCSYGPRYVRPRGHTRKADDYAVRAVAEKQRRRRERGGRTQIILG